MQVFPIMMYVLGSILLVVTIILVIKLIYTVDKANEILDNVEAKVKTLDGFFNAINMTSSAISSIGDRVIGAVAGLLPDAGRTFWRPMADLQLPGAHRLRRQRRSGAETGYPTTKLCRHQRHGRLRVTHPGHCSRGAAAAARFRRVQRL